MAKANLSTVETPAIQEGVLPLAPMALHYGGTLAQGRLAWRLEGRAGAPVVVTIGGISASRRVFGPQLTATEGWWSEVAGPGRALDCGRVRVLGIDYLGGQGESTGPEGIAAAQGRSADLGSISTYDQAEALRQLLDHLGIAELRAIVGASYGGMVALAFAERYAARVGRLVVISAADRAHPMATAWRCVQRQLLRFALAQQQPAMGLTLARALAMATYRSPEEFAARFDAEPVREQGRFVFPVESYLFARGRDYAQRARADAFLCLSESIDLHRVDATRIAIPVTVVAVREDQLVPLADMRALTARLPQGQLQELSSPHGHDAFLKEGGQLRAIFTCVYGEC